MDNDTKLLNLALDAGEIMLMSGAETYRVQDTMLRILSVSGREKIEALALSTMLIVSLPREDKGPLSMARGVRNRSVNFEKICAVNEMSRAFVSGNISLEQATITLQNIHNAPRFSNLATIISYSLTSGGLTLVYNGTLLDSFIAFIIGLILGIAAILNNKWKTPYFFNPLLGGVITGILAMSFCTILPQTQVDMIIVGSIMPLLPGLTLTKAIRDILEGHFISGSSRFVEALLVACGIAGGVALGIGLFPIK